jgi:hypothetical protein
MWNSIWFDEEQLHWIEDLPECYVKVISLPEGESFVPRQAGSLYVLVTFLPLRLHMSVGTSGDLGTYSPGIRMT